MVESKQNVKTDPGAETGNVPAAPITYTFDGRAFVVQPVFKGNGAASISDVLLRLMRADLEQS